MTQLVSVQFDGDGNMGRKTLMGTNAMDFRAKVVKTGKGRFHLIRRQVDPQENMRRELFAHSLRFLGRHVGNLLLRAGSMITDTLVVDHYHAPANAESEVSIRSGHADGG